ncbi:MAG: c-type cytochrome [Rhodospirillales bacterium]
MTCGALDPARKNAGRQVYNARCYFCHGYQGNADTVAAGYLDPRPRDFTMAVDLDPVEMRSVIVNGRPDTAMQGFGKSLSATEIDAVATFIEEEFIRCRRRNARYHTAENGWPEHEKRNAAAFRFVTGALGLDTPDDSLTPEERRGQAIFRASCIVCHEGRVRQSRQDSHERDEDHVEDEAHEYDRAYGGGGAAEHDRAPALAEVTPQQALGARLYEQNCASCHALDGTGRNWIGRFLQPHPPDFARPETAARFDNARLRQAIAAGLPDSSMPAFGTVLAPDQVAAITAYIEYAFFRHTGRNAGSTSPEHEQRR